MKFDNTTGIYLHRACSSPADQNDQEGEVFGSLICAGSGKVNKMIGQ